MPLLTIEISDELMESIEKDAETEGKSVSSYALETLLNRHHGNREEWKNGWPPGFFDLYGSSPNFPDVEDLPPQPVETWY